MKKATSQGLLLGEKVCARQQACLEMIKSSVRKSEERAVCTSSEATCGSGLNQYFGKEKMSREETKTVAYKRTMPRPSIKNWEKRRDEKR